MDTTDANPPLKEDKQPQAQPRVVIVGAGFGGLEAAKALRHVPVQVIIIDRWNHHLFQPMLYQVATAGLSIEDISAPIRRIFSRQANASVLMAEVVGVDTEKQEVLTTDQTVPYDYLVLATGASSNYFGHDAWQQWAPGLKSLQDAMVLRRQILGAFEAAENEPDPQRTLLANDTQRRKDRKIGQQMRRAQQGPASRRKRNVYVNVCAGNGTDPSRNHACRTGSLSQRLAGDATAR